MVQSTLNNPITANVGVSSLRDSLSLGSSALLSSVLVLEKKVSMNVKVENGANTNLHISKSDLIEECIL